MLLLGVLRTLLSSHQEALEGRRIFKAERKQQPERAMSPSTRLSSTRVASTAAQTPPPQVPSSAVETTPDAEEPEGTYHKW